MPCRFEAGVLVSDCPRVAPPTIDTGDGTGAIQRAAMSCALRASRLFPDAECPEQAFMEDLRASIEESERKAEEEEIEAFRKEIEAITGEGNA